MTSRSRCASTDTSTAASCATVGIRSCSSRPDWGIASASARPSRRSEPRGQTPLGYSLEQISADLGDFAGERAVVLVTDGIESCGGDPCRGRRSAPEASGAPVHVIGFGLGNAEDEDLAGLRAIAEASNGKFLTARSAEELRDALTVTVGTTYRVSREGTTVATGTLGADDLILLPAGDYVVELDSRPPHEVPVTLASEESLALVLARDGRRGVSLETTRSRRLPRLRGAAARPGLAPGAGRRCAARRRSGPCRVDRASRRTGPRPRRWGRWTSVERHREHVEEGARQPGHAGAFDTAAQAKEVVGAVAPVAPILPVGLGALPVLRLRRPPGARQPVPARPGRRELCDGLVGDLIRQRGTAPRQRTTSRQRCRPLRSRFGSHVMIGNPPAPLDGRRAVCSSGARNGSPARGKRGGGTRSRPPFPGLPETVGGTLSLPSLAPETVGGTRSPFCPSPFCAPRSLRMWATGGSAGSSPR